MPVATNRLRLSLLSAAAFDQIEETAQRLLEQVGISLQHAAALEMLRGLGCWVDRGRVFIPPDAVRWGLDHVTRASVCRSSDGTQTCMLGDGQVRFHNAGGPPFVFDLESGKRRPALLRDVADSTRLLDALPNVDVITPLFGPQDEPASTMAIAATGTMLCHTRKPVQAAAVEKPEEVRYILAMAHACCGGEEAFRRAPTLSFGVSPVSPLRFTEQVVASIMAVAESGAAFHALPAPSLGATAPITLAGALAQQHAEVLASLLIAAATRPGVPVAYCSRINPIDLRTATSSWGGPEIGMSGAAAAELAHRLGLVCDSYGLSTNSGLLDPQFAYERLANALLPALAGVDMLSGVGAMESGLSGGYEAAVIDDEIISLLKRIVRGFEVDEDTLAFDLMQEVIPRDGVFLAEMHTVREMRRGALWVPKVSERFAATTGEMMGVTARAREKAREILRCHCVEPLADDVSQQIGEIMDEARRELT